MVFMGTITTTVDDAVETKFRKAVKEKLGTGKGKLGKAVTEAMKSWAESAEQQKVREEAIKQLEKGFNWGGKILYKHRSELYDR